MNSFKHLLLNLFSILLTLTSVTSYSITVTPKSQHCFLIKSSSSDTITGSYEIITGEPDQVIVTVTGPPPINFLHYESKFKPGIDSDKDLSEGEFSFIANKPGDYKICILSNDSIHLDDTTLITIAFNFRTISGEQDYEYKGLESE